MPFRSKFTCFVTIAAIIFITVLPNAVWLARGVGSAPLLFGVIPSIGTVVLLLAIAGRVHIGLALLTPFAMLAPWEIFYILNYDQPSSEHVIGIIADTNSEEAAAFMAGIAGPLTIASAVIFIIGFFGCWQARRAGYHWRHRTRYWILSSSFFAIIILLGFYAWGEKKFDDALVLKSYENANVSLGDGATSASIQFKNSYPVGVFWRVSSYWYQRGRFSALADVKNDFHFNAYKVNALLGKEIYVLVIGETSRPDRWELNGYQRKTNPHLSIRKDIISFSDAVSPWAWTRMSVPLLITRKPPQSRADFFPEKSVISAFKEAGFRTYWLSAQGAMGMQENPVAIYANEADTVEFINLTEYKQQGSYDQDLLKPLGRILSESYDRKFIVIHTLGSHFNYSHRYPEKYDVYKPSLTGVKSASLHDDSLVEELNNSYDNSIVYTDAVIQKMLKLLDQQQAVSFLFYIADHGENLFDNGCEKSGHGHNTERDFRVASLAWLSSKYSAINPEKSKRLIDRRDQPLYSPQVFHTLLDMADIQYQGQKLEMSFASDKWKKVARWTQNSFDFDLAAREKTCQILQNHSR